MLRRLEWVGSAKRDLKRLPDHVTHEFGYALYLAQRGRTPVNAKPLKGFGSAGVVELIENWQGNSYRAAYTVRYEPAVFVLHVFQKKAKSGIATSKRDMDLIRARLKAAEAILKEWADEARESQTDPH